MITLSTSIIGLKKWTDYSPGGAGGGVPPLLDVVKDVAAVYVKGGT